MDSHQRHLSRGFNWLGSATLLAKIIDFSTTLAVLLFLTKEQVGIAALVVSVGMVIEALDGFGTSQALVQAPSITRHQLDTLFWFIFTSALAIGALTWLAAPWIAKIYGIAGMASYFLAIAIKQPLVGAAVIPLAILNRNLQYERIAIVNLCATLGAAATRLGLAVSGAGAWALVIAYVASGAYTLIGAQLAHPFRPGLRFNMGAISSLLRFGLSATASNIFEQLFRNVDFLLVGWFYGTSSLAIYRVAFDVAMEPAMAVGILINRTALPVLARVAAVREHLAQSLRWSLGRIAALVFPLMVGLALAADPLTALLHDEQGHSYAAAALPLKLLAAAALMRVTSQLLYPLMMGSGRPGEAARLSGATLLLLSAGIFAAGLSFPAQSGIVAMSAVWLAVYPLLLVWAAFYLRREWNIRAAELAGAFTAPGLAIGSLVAIGLLANLLVADSDPRIKLGVVIVATALTYGGLFVYSRSRPVQTA